MNTKKDFIRAAKQISAHRYGKDSDLQKTLWQVVENQFALFFASDNPRFDEQRFREACK